MYYYIDYCLFCFVPYALCSPKCLAFSWKINIKKLEIFISSKKNFPVLIEKYKICCFLRDLHFNLKLF